MPKKLRIFTKNNKKDLEILKTKSAKITVEEIKSEKFQSFLEDLIHTAQNFELKEGWVTAGLAAVQVGKPIRVFISLETEKNEYKIYINPEIEYIGNIQEADTEGCLSVPEKQANIYRHKKIKIKYLDREGNEKKEKCSENNARIIQHEHDHLEGILFIDKI